MSTGIVGAVEATETDDAGAAGAAPPLRPGHGRTASIWWATGFVTVTVIALAALDGAALTLHALTYGFTQVLDPGSVAVPDTDRYTRALVVGALLTIAMTCAMLGLLLRTAARRWPAWITALLAAGVGGVVGASALLLVLGISPLSLLMS